MTQVVEDHHQIKKEEVIQPEDEPNLEFYCLICGVKVDKEHMKEHPVVVINDSFDVSAFKDKHGSEIFRGLLSEKDMPNIFGKKQQAVECPYKVAVLSGTQKDTFKLKQAGGTFS